MPGVKPPIVPLGSRLSVTLEVQIQDKKRRDTDHVNDVMGKWVARYVERHWSWFTVEGWSARMEPGRTYRDWWFGDVEVYLNR